MSRISKSQYLRELRGKVVPQGPFHVTPYFVEKARGAVIYDVEGRELIDFSAGLGVMNVGHCHPEVVAAIRDQAERYTHTCFHIVMYEPYLELADKLCQLTPGSFPKMAMFANSGAEAVENAVKVARHYTGRPGVITFEHAFHGRTLFALSLTSKVRPYKFGFGPFAPEVYRMPEWIDVVKQISPKSVQLYTLDRDYPSSRICPLKKESKNTYFPSSPRKRVSENA